MAAWSYVPSFRWGLQVKQDRDEAFAMIDQQRLARSACCWLLTVAAGGVGRLAGGPVDHPADPRGRPGRRPGGRAAT